MKKILILLVLSLTSVSAWSEDDFVLDEPVAENVAPVEGSEVDEYLNSIANENAALSVVMSDVVDIKRERCDLALGFKDIKLISSKDAVFKELEDKVESDPTYPKSFEYKNKIKTYFGKCSWITL
nr:hypothetical protein [Providencia rettgeri]